MKKSILIKLLFVVMITFSMNDVIGQGNNENALTASKTDVSIEKQTTNGLIAEVASNDVKPVVYQKVDTIENIDQILDEGLFYIKNPPEKGASVATWVAYIFGILTLIGSIIFFFIKKFKPNKTE